MSSDKKSSNAAIKNEIANELCDYIEPVKYTIDRRTMIEKKET